ncbi:S53 family peptidase [Terriglobus roseus]|uniref:Subtilase family protein n=1 Tax=Terriglobus roseus TaxID=392734 RepID=A0A1G7PN73_9BACT|nr:protease pro-enzyme activation domain-containing protein [Terriglobus roseus]SDF87872.1 Subtilase family protein [Terriglobus roseus]
MTHTSSLSLRSAVAAAALLAATMFPAFAGSQVVRRLSTLPSSSESRVSLPDTVSPRVKSASVTGHLSSDTQLSGMSLIFNLTDAQKADLTQLLADQQNPSSAQYHKWLTPQTYGQRFGLSDADLSIVKDWLTSKGFTVDDVAPSRNRIVFSGTAAAVEGAFTTTLQRFHRADQDYFENSTAISLPQSLAGVVSGITGISSYHIQPPVHTPQAIAPQYTDGSGAHYLVPWDFRQIFGMNTLINAGFNGSGIKIGVIGQSSVDSNQLTYFQQKTGQTVTLPTLVLVPNTGSSGQLSKGDEGESELDLEYASGSAPGAQVLFIYTGTSTATTNNGVFTALIYAVTNNLAPILTLSYGGCESSNASYASTVMEPVLAQASSQGQTILVSSGDTGPAECELSTNTTTTATQGLSVAYPASSPNVTAVGGTQLNSDASTYWSSSNNSYGGSAVGYMPETSWNDTVAYKSLSASGGGYSTVFGKPSWQTGTGVPTDGHRDVPDVAFPAAVEEHAYIICSVDAPCTTTAGFGSSAGGGGLIGGTSASTPNFAAMLAIVEQANGGGALGNINSKLYTLAAGSSASSVFHDITTGNNIVNCSGGSSGCSSTTLNTTGTMGYSAGTGYDMVTGLGSLDANGLSTALKASTGTGGKLTPTISLGAATTTPTSGSTDLLTVTISGSGTAPTGSIVLAVDGTTVTTFASASASNTYTYTVPTCTITTANNCVHSVTALYAGDTNYFSASATINLSVPTTSTATSGSIALTPAAATLTVTSGNTGTDVITIASTGFAGTVSFKATTSASLNACYNLPSVTVASNASATSTFTVYTATSNCTSASAQSLGTKIASSQPTRSPWQRGGVAVLAAGLVGAFFLRKRMRPASLLLLALFSVGAFSLSGCGGSSSSTSTTTGGSTTATGTYPLTITATGVPSNGATSISATTTVTLVVQ